MADRKVRVRLRTSVAAPTWSWAAGEIVGMPVAQAREWCRIGYAEPVDPLDEPETAEAKPTAEQAVRRRKRKS